VVSELISFFRCAGRGFDVVAIVCVPGVVAGSLGSGDRGLPIWALGVEGNHPGRIGAGRERIRADQERRRAAERR
jgi:hypothetical protein